ncbi:MAG: MFS transporter, partial [Promethearchaeota archaeon]
MENIENLGNAEKSLKDEKTAEKEETGRGTKKEGNGVKKDLRGKESKSLGISVKDERELSVKEKIKKYLPVAIFLPLIILMGSDAAILLVNQVLVQIEFNLGHNFKIIGMIVGLSLLSQAVATMIFGYLADKYSRKKILLIGASIWSFGEIMVYLTPPPNIAWLLIFRLLASAGAGSSTPVTMSILGDIFSAKKRGMSFAWWGLATTIGGLGGGSIATAFNPIFGDSSYNNLPSLAAKILYISETYPMEVIDRWRIPFLIMGMLGIIFTILILFVKEPKRGSSEVELKDILENTDIDYSNSYKIKLSDLKIIYQRKSNFWLIFNFVDTIFSGLILGFAITWLTIEVGLDFKADTIMAVLPFVLILVAGLLFGQFYFPKLGDKKVKNGDYAGRAKVAIMCGVVHIVFLIIGFGFYPNFGAKTFFKGALDLSSDPAGFEIMVIIDAIIIAIGLAFEFGIG